MSLSGRVLRVARQVFCEALGIQSSVSTIQPAKKNVKKFERIQAGSGNIYTSCIDCETSTGITCGKEDQWTTIDIQTTRISTSHKPFL